MKSLKVSLVREVTSESAETTVARAANRAAVRRFCCMAKAVMGVSGKESGKEEKKW